MAFLTFVQLQAIENTFLARRAYIVIDWLDNFDSNRPNLGQQFYIILQTDVNCLILFNLIQYNTTDL